MAKPRVRNKPILYLKIKSKYSLKLDLTLIRINVIFGVPFYFIQIIITDEII
jgi:hypothetical protein